MSIVRKPRQRLHDACNFLGCDSWNILRITQLYKRLWRTELWEVSLTNIVLASQFTLLISMLWIYLLLSCWLHWFSQSSFESKLFRFPSHPPYSKISHCPLLLLKYHFSKLPLHVPVSGFNWQTSPVTKSNTIFYVYNWQFRGWNSIWCSRSLS